MTKRSELEKLTATKLRELAHQYEEIKGASGLTKDQLIQAIVAAMRTRGTFQEEPTHSASIDQLEAQRLKVRTELGPLIRNKRALLAAETHDHAQLKEVRAKIKRLRRRIHRIRIQEAQLKKILKLQS
jgi:hypothetical protein